MMADTLIAPARGAPLLRFSWRLIPTPLSDSVRRRRRQGAVRMRVVPAAISDGVFLDAVAPLGPPQVRACCAHLVGCAVHQLPYDAEFAACTCPVDVGSIRHEPRLSGAAVGASKAT